MIFNLMFKRLCALVCFSMVIGLSAHANILDNFNKRIGEGSLHYLFWHVYDISLDANENFTFQKPFTLNLSYKMKLSGHEIARRSIDEIKGLGFEDSARLEKWHLAMKNIFPDVSDGVILSGLYKPNQPTKFYKNNAFIGTVNDPEFGKWFFGIWLDEKTSEPKLRRQLLGLNNEN
ncbi:MAG: hypothetical protein ACI9TY_000177 [Alphaproteobacteria bacterium]|jgi:hypothetical protein